MAENQMVVRMVSHITGGRHDGRPWPDAGALIEVPEWEGRDLISGRMATLPSPAEQQAWHDEHVRPAAEAAEAEAVEAEQLAEGSGPEIVMSPPDPRAEVSAVTPSYGQPAAAGEAPSPSAPKQAWVDYAVSTGKIDVHAAQAMTKADLMHDFGGRL